MTLIDAQNMAALSAAVRPRCGQRGRVTKLIRSAIDCQGCVDTNSARDPLPAGASRTARPGRHGKNWRISQLALPTRGGQLHRQAMHAPNRSFKIRDTEEDHEPGLGGFVHSARDACRLDRRAVAATFVKLPAEQLAVKNLRPSRVWHPDLEMRGFSHTIDPSSA